MEGIRFTGRLLSGQGKEIGQGECKSMQVTIDLNFDVEEIGATRSGARHTGPSFTAYEQPESRVPRLAEAYGHARETVKRMSVKYQNAFDGAVSNLHDHKGLLEITWRDGASRVMFEGVIAGAWEAVGEHMTSNHLVQTESSG